MILQSEWATKKDKGIAEDKLSSHQRNSYCNSVLLHWWLPNNLLCFSHMDKEEDKEECYFPRERTATGRKQKPAELKSNTWKKPNYSKIVILVVNMKYFSLLQNIFDVTFLFILTELLNSDSVVFTSYIVECFKDLWFAVHFYRIYQKGVCFQAWVTNGAYQHLFLSFLIPSIFSDYIIDGRLSPLHFLKIVTSLYKHSPTAFSSVADRNNVERDLILAMLLSFCKVSVLGLKLICISGGVLCCLPHFDKQYIYVYLNFSFYLK